MAGQLRLIIKVNDIKGLAGGLLALTLIVKVNRWCSSEAIDMLSA
jgi:hypothetical protein